jgi:hypothetical protein
VFKNGEKMRKRNWIYSGNGDIYYTKKCGKGGGYLTAKITAVSYKVLGYTKYEDLPDSVKKQVIPKQNEASNTSLDQVRPTIAETRTTSSNKEVTENG